MGVFPHCRGIWQLKLDRDSSKSQFLCHGALKSTYHSKLVKIFHDIQNSCDQTLEEMGYQAESYLLPGGVGIKFKDEPIHNLHALQTLPIIECDLSDLESFDLNCLNREKISSLILPDKNKLPFSELNSFRLTRLKATKACSSDFGSLSEHPLETLELPYSSIKDIMFCQNMPLRKLDLAGTQISQFPRLRNAKITSLNLFKTNIEEMSGFDCHALKEIVISGSPIKSITILADASNLLKVEMRATPVSDLSPLASTPIKELHLPGSQVKSINCLAYLPIETLNIIGLELEDIYCLSTLPLKSLALSPQLLNKEDYEFIANLKIPFLRGPADSPEQTAEEFFQKYLIQ